MQLRFAFVIGCAVVLTAAASGAPGRTDTVTAAKQAAEVTSAPATSTAAATPPRPSLVCRLPRSRTQLPAWRRHGLIGHLRQYPVVALATPRQRRRAQRLLDTLMAAAERHRWRDVRAAARAGYDTRTAPRETGDRSVHYFHAERDQEPRGSVVLNPNRPKALIYANAPGRPLSLVGAMWSMRDGELGPTPGGPITRWHSHVVCKQGKKRGLGVPASGRCPPGSRLTQGASEMMHIWFTGNLRSAFAIRRPEPELCAAGLLPAEQCRRG